MAILTKSKYLNGLQCHRLLWHKHNKLLPEPSISDKHKFAQGYKFEKYVKKLYPEAVELGELSFKENLEKTKENIMQTKAIFEAGFKEDNLFIRADLITPNGEDWDPPKGKGWNLYEIKSTTQVKPVHIQDLAFQKYVIEKTGLKIEKCFVIHLNKEYTRQGEISPKELITIEEVTEKVELVEDIEYNTKLCMNVLDMESYEDIPISQNCNKPYECPLKKACWSTLPENNVTQLSNWRVYWKLMGEGIEDINDIPADTKLSGKDHILIRSLKKTPQINKEEIKIFLDELHYPLYHFDFETFDTAVPLFDNSRPYQKIPFQYSLHIEQKDGTTEHREFLSEGGDPRPALLEQMKEDLGQKGDIIVFNKSFEMSVMQKLAEAYPEHKEWLDAAIIRIVDLAEPFKTYHYYDKSQKGSYSIKKVLPAITGKGYEALDIANGADASMLYFYSHIKNDIKKTETLRQQLLEYCNLDTEGMVWIIQELKRMMN